MPSLDEAEQVRCDRVSPDIVGVPSDLRVDRGDRVPCSSEFPDETGVWSTVTSEDDGDLERAPVGYGVARGAGV